MNRLWQILLLPVQGKEITDRGYEKKETYKLNINSFDENFKKEPEQKKYVFS